MTKPRVLLDPTGERGGVRRGRLPRPASLDGMTVGLLDISKPRGDVFLERLAAHLIQRGVKIQRFTKPTYARPAPIDLCQKIAVQCDVVIEALAD